tara:strand:- start:374 stop:574 length:201 start_codon:yes stop_codon:yes gene_type:complete
MQIGDLVKMRPGVWWWDRKTYTAAVGIVIELEGHLINVLLETGELKSYIADQWSVINDEIKTVNSI